MAIVFTEGFDNYSNSSGTNLATKWTSPGDLTVSSSVTPYNYGQAASWTNVTNLPNFGLTTATNTATVGVAFRTNGLSASPNSISARQHIYMNTSAGYTMGLQLNNDGSVQVNRMTGFSSGVVLGVSTAKPILAGTFYYIEFSVLLSTTVGTVRVDVNGQNIINLTGQNTQNGASNLINTILFGTGNSSVTTYLDDIYVTDTTTPLGPQRIETLRPSADTAQKQWTASTGTDNYAMVDESPMNTTDYVYTSTLNNYDLYDFSNLSATPSSISSVTAYSLAQKDNVGTRAIAVPVKSGSTTNDGANVYLASGWTLAYRILETDPNTSSAWTASAVNSIQAGLKVTI